MKTYGDAVDCVFVALLLVRIPVALSDTHFVYAGSPSPQAPYTNWLNAATNIQQAVNSAQAGDTVLVSNGVYVLWSQISVSNAITLRSENGAKDTVVDGDLFTRCVYLGHSSAVLDGFTVTRGLRGIYSSGATIRNCIITGNPGGGVECNGGLLQGCVISLNTGVNYGTGVRCEYGGTVQDCLISNNICSGAGVEGGGIYLNRGAVVTNCIVVDNQAGPGGNGGGIWSAGGTIMGCTILRNVAPYYSGSGHGGGIYCTGVTSVRDCDVRDNEAGGQGGGLSGGVIERCLIKGNRADAGGGAYGAVLRNCLIVDNMALGAGGGVDIGSLENCTVSRNSVMKPNGIGGGGVLFLDGGSATNTIIWDNAATNGPQYLEIRTSNCMSYCCTVAYTGGRSNIVGNPLFVNAPAGDYHLSTNSPCIDAGTNLPSVTVDLDGVARPLDGNKDGTQAYDMGAYEYGAQ